MRYESHSKRASPLSSLSSVYPGCSIHHSPPAIKLLQQRAGSRLVTNLKLKVNNWVYCFLHREDYGPKVGDTNKEEEEDDEEEGIMEDKEEEQEEEEGDNEDEIEENAEYEEGDTL